MKQILFLLLFLILLGCSGVGPENIEQWNLESNSSFYALVPLDIAEDKDTCGIYYDAAYEEYNRGLYYDIDGVAAIRDNEYIIISKANGIKYISGQYAAAKTEYTYQIAVERSAAGCLLSAFPLQGFSQGYRYENEYAPAPDFTEREAESYILSPRMGLKFNIITDYSHSEIIENYRKNLKSYNIPDTFYAHQYADIDGYYYFYIGDDEYNHGIARVQMNERFTKTIISVQIDSLKLDLTSSVKNQIEKVKEYFSAALREAPIYY